jgi:hypothetical protein
MQYQVRSEVSGDHFQVTEGLQTRGCIATLYSLSSASYGEHAWSLWRPLSHAMRLRDCSACGLMEIDDSARTDTVQPTEL